MPDTINVMIIDDSVVYRNMLREALLEYRDINIVAQAVNGRLALPRIRHYKPDILILDQEMPEMTGIETLEVVRRDHPEVEVIMFSSLTVQGAKVTLQALNLGAFDFVTKPDFERDGDPRDFIKKHLVPLIRSCYSIRHGVRPAHYEVPGSGAGDSSGAAVESRDAAAKIAAVEAQKATPIVAKVAPARAGEFELCAIGISTGGPVALRKLMPVFEAKIGGAIVIVQHMPPLFTRQLAESLDGITKLNVVEGEDGMAIESGRVYIAPGGRHMVVHEIAGSRRIKILDTPPEGNCRPSVNVLFRSVAEIYGPKAVGVIMTGMGVDGYEGMRLMKERGSYLIAQNEESSLVWGMPALPTKQGLVEESLEIEKIAARVQHLLGGLK